MSPLDYAASGGFIGALVFALSVFASMLRDKRRARRMAVEYRPRQGTLERRSRAR
jgi:hypothetical protein